MASQLACLEATRLPLHLCPHASIAIPSSPAALQSQKARISHGILKKRGFPWTNYAAAGLNCALQGNFHRECLHARDSRKAESTMALLSPLNSKTSSESLPWEHSFRTHMRVPVAAAASVILFLASSYLSPVWAAEEELVEAFPPEAVESELVVEQTSGQSDELATETETETETLALSLSRPETEALALLPTLPPLPTEFPPLPEVSLPKYEKVVLPNGLRIFLVEDHEIGLVEGQLLVRGGGRTEPAEKVGLARLVAAVQRSGGSIAHPSNVLDSLLERKAASIEVSSSASQMAVAFSSLAEDLPDILPLFSEVVQQPAMPEEKLSLARNQLLASIERRNDNPEGIAAREFGKLLYGRDSKYARTSEVNTVKAVTRSDLLAFHAANFRPEAAVLGLWGDFDSAATKQLLERTFGSWQGSATIPAALPLSIDTVIEDGFAASDAQIYLISKPGLTQGYVRMGELGTTLSDPDIYALDVLNSVLNGFGGRLFDEVRSRAGLAYSVSGAWSPAVEHRGTFVAGGATRLDALPQFVAQVKRVLTQATLSPPTQDELERAKDAALNSFVFNFADSGSQLRRIMTYDLFGIPQDFVFDYQARVAATSAQDVLLAAQNHLHPNQHCILIVTDADLISSSLDALDIPLQVISIS